MVTENPRHYPTLRFRPLRREHNVIMRRRPKAIRIGLMRLGIPKLKEPNGAVAPEIIHIPRSNRARVNGIHAIPPGMLWRFAVSDGSQFAHAHHIHTIRSIQACRIER